MNSLRQGVIAAEQAYLKMATSDQDDQESASRKEQLWKAFVRTNDPSMPRLIDLARVDPKSAAAFQALEFIVTNRRIQSRALLPYALQAAEMLGACHAANPEIGRACSAMGRNWDPKHKPTLELLREVMESNPNRTARGQAILALARLAIARAGIGTDIGAKKERKDAEGLLGKIQKEYADVADPYQTDNAEHLLGSIASRELYDLKYLSVGCVAPDLVGEDLDGRKLALSDYRGKTVVVVFWATWCGPCMRAIPHERTLLKRMEGKPFVLLGVNGDEDRTHLKPVLEREGITWRSFWDGSSKGPIAEKWNVKSWPTVYVLDGNGVIRFKDYGDQMLDSIVDELVKEAEAKTNSTTTQLPP